MMTSRFRPPRGQLRASPTRGGELDCDDRAVANSVLVIDDDPAFRDLVRRMLDDGGLVVVGEADTAAAAIATAHELRPDVALVDVGLPDGDGIALARELSSLPWHPRVVLTSSDPEAASAEDVRRSGAHAFVPKDELPDAPLGPLLGSP
jgi:DNA-binding NarL/FixJ family response regulator